MAFNLKDYALENGQLESYAWPGGYPLYYLTKDCGTLCPKCCNENLELLFDPNDPQWFLVAVGVNWEDTSLFCDHCSHRIESAYGDDEPPTNGDSNGSSTQS